MKVLNAGLEKIEFGFNQNSRDKRFGGFYSVAPDEQIDVPEEARDLILDPRSGPGLRGLVILDFGTDVESKKREGLENLKRFTEQRIEWELQRQEEKKQVGLTTNIETLELKHFNALLAKIEGKLNGNATSNGNQSADESKRSNISTSEVSKHNNKKSA